MKRSIFKFICATALCLAVSASAQAQSGSDFTWQYYQYNDADDRGRTVSNLVHGIPETDAVSVFGECRFGASERLSRLSLALDVSGLRPGANVNVKFTVDQFITVLNGSVTDQQFNKRISGVEILIGNSSPLWRAMMAGSRVSYSTRGRSNTLSLRGSAGPMRNFVEDCQFYADQRQQSAGGQKPEQPNSKPTDPRWATCDFPGNKRSLNSDTPVTVTFRNTSGEYRSVEWMDFNGNPVNYATLNPGEEYTQRTYLTHPWMFTDGPGNCIEIFQPSLGVNVFEIGARSPGFGPE